MLALSAVLLIFSFQFSLLFSMSEAGKLQRRTCFTQYRTSDVAENVGSTFLVRGVESRGKTGLILTVKVETRRPVEG